jgi:hypothetical protein
MIDHTVTHDVLLTRGGHTRKFRVYGRAMPETGDIITLPIDGQLVKARVVAAPARTETAPSADAEAVELVEGERMELV